MNKEAKCTLTMMLALTLVLWMLAFGQGCTPAISNGYLEQTQVAASDNIPETSGCELGSTTIYNDVIVTLIDEDCDGVCDYAGYVLAHPAAPGISIVVVSECWYALKLIRDYQAGKRFEGKDNF